LPGSGNLNNIRPLESSYALFSARGQMVNIRQREKEKSWKFIGSSARQPLPFKKHKSGQSITNY